MLRERYVSLGVPFYLGVEKMRDHILDFKSYFEELEERTAGELVTKNNDGSNAFPYIKFNSEVRDFIKTFYNSEYVDDDYIENMNEISDYRNVNEEHTILELSTILTYIIRRDRFVTGLLLAHIEDGLIFRILNLLQKRSLNNE